MIIRQEESTDISAIRKIVEAAFPTAGEAKLVDELTPETFLLSYSLPNFFFHSVTAYNILRTRGVPLGKYHYQGQLRTRPV